MREEVKVKRMGQFYDFQCYTILAERATDQLYKNQRSTILQKGMIAISLCESHYEG